MPRVALGITQLDGQRQALNLTADTLTEGAAHEVVQREMPAGTIDLGLRLGRTFDGNR